MDHITLQTLTVANQTEVPVLHYANIILNTTVDKNSRYFSVLFAVADIKYNILGTPFFEDKIQNINTQDFTLEFKYQSKTLKNYTQQQFIHIEALVTFSLGLQPTSEHEFKFWHARRMAFIQGSLTGTALSWYIRLNVTYKQNWHAFVQAFKKQFSSQKNAY